MIPQPSGNNTEQAGATPASKYNAVAELFASTFPSERLSGLERIYKDPAVRQEQMLAALRHELAVFKSERLRSALLQIDGAAAPALAPEPELPKPAPVSQPAKKNPARSSKPPARRPSRIDDPGLTAVVDSGLAEQIGPNATLAWLCLLRHANGREGRKVSRIGYGAISRGTGLSRQQVRDGIEMLLARHLVYRLRVGRIQGHGNRTYGARTSEYFVPFPTPSRLEKWCAGAEADLAEMLASSVVQNTNWEVEERQEGPASSVVGNTA